MRLIQLMASRAPDATLKHYDADHFTVFAEPVLGRIIADQVEFLRSRNLL